jgi:hypothetical protein
MCQALNTLNQFITWLKILVFPTGYEIAVNNFLLRCMYEADFHSFLSMGVAGEGGGGGPGPPPPKNWLCFLK